MKCIIIYNNFFYNKNACSIILGSVLPESVTRHHQIFGSVSEANPDATLVAVVVVVVVILVCQLMIVCHMGPVGMDLSRTCA